MLSMRTLVVMLGISISPITQAQDLSTVESSPWWDFLEMKPLFTNIEASKGNTEGWSVVGGKASYDWKKDSSSGNLDGGWMLHGSGRAPRNAFLTSQRDFGDFMLEVDVKIDAGAGNSGIQIRSHESNQHLVGYQIEIDSSPRSWSGGLYDEARRGWLASLQDNVDAQEAFAPGEWNTYRILCIGPRIRTWINGVPAVDHLDFADLSGRIAFQVHSGQCDVYWRNARIADLGIREWKTLLDVASHQDDDRQYTIDPPGAALIQGGGLQITPDGATIRLHEQLPEAVSVLVVKATMKSGTMGLKIGEQAGADRVSYRLRVPSPLGTPGKPGIIQVVQGPDGTTVIIDGAPLVPGPPNLQGPLPVTLEFTEDGDARIMSVDLLPPTTAETEALASARELNRKARDEPAAGEQNP